MHSTNSKFFQLGLNFTLRWEGKYVNHPNDPGKATNFGVSLPYAQRVGIDKDKDGDTDANDIKLLTIEDAVALYKRDYWDKYGCGSLSIPLCVAVFDCYVNHSPKTVGILLKKAAGDWKKLITARKDYYGWRVSQKATQKIFLRGWLNRTNDLWKYCAILEEEKKQGLL